MGREVLPCTHHVGSVLPRPCNCVVRHALDGMRAEVEAGDNSEVAPAPAAAGPVEIGMLGATAGQNLPSRRHDREPEEAVAGQPQLAAGVTGPTAEGETGDPDARARAGGDRGRTLRKLRIDVDQECPGPDHRAALLIDRKSTRLNSSHGSISY